MFAEIYETGMTLNGEFSIGSKKVIDSSGNWVGSSTGIKGQKGQQGGAGTPGSAGKAGDKGQKGAVGATFSYDANTRVLKITT